MKIVCMCVVYFIGTAYFFDDPFSKFILIFWKMFPGFMHLARFQRTLQWWRGTLHLQRILNQGHSEHLPHSVLKFIPVVDISFKQIFLHYIGKTKHFVHKSTIIIKFFQSRQKEICKMHQESMSIVFQAVMLEKYCIHQCL